MEKTIEYGVCPKDQEEEILAILERLYICHAAYVLHKSSQRLQRHMRDWWRLKRSLGKKIGGMIELESPCLHRVHTKKTDVPVSYHTLGMTIELKGLLNRLELLHKTNLNNETTSYADV